MVTRIVMSYALDNMNSAIFEILMSTKKKLSSRSDGLLSECDENKDFKYLHANLFQYELN